MKWPANPITAHTGGGFWGILGSRDPGIELALFDATGLVKRTLRLNPRWWVAIDMNAVSRYQKDRTVDVPPYSAALDIHEDVRGRLWIASRVPSPDWTKYPTENVPNRGQVESPKRYNTMLELIDPSTGKTLASQRLQKKIMQFIDDTHIVTSSEDDDGNEIFEIYSIQLK
jgi:hypothetical protein